MRRTPLVLTLALLLTCDSPNPTAPASDDAPPSMMGAPSPNVTITLSPPVAYLEERDTLRFTATVESDGDTLGVDVDWYTTHTGVAQVDTAGLVTAFGDGFAVLVAQYGSALGAAAIVVDTPADTLSVSVWRVSVTPSAPVWDIVAERRFLLRVFATANRKNDLELNGVAVLGNEDDTVAVVPLIPPTGGIPMMFDEDSLQTTFHAVIPDSLVKATDGRNLQMLIDLDPENQTRCSECVRWHANPDIRDPDPFHLVIVPVLWDSVPDYRILDWTEGLTADSFRIHEIRDMLPVRQDYPVTVLDPFTTKQDLTTGAGWRGLLRETDSIRIADGTRAYYYGAVIPPAGSPYGGIGYIGYPAGAGSLGAIAHEIGHNMSLNHAPCGGPSGVDPGYPYEDGTIGQRGFSFYSRTLKDPEVFHDVMSYCRPRWISDYHFNKALAYRIHREPLWWDAAADMEPPEIIADPLLPGWEDSHQR